jgi:hypothetical protein
MASDDQLKQVFHSLARERSHVSMSELKDMLVQFNDASGGDPMDMEMLDEFGDGQIDLDTFTNLVHAATGQGLETTPKVSEPFSPELDRRGEKMTRMVSLADDEYAELDRAYQLALTDLADVQEECRQWKGKTKLEEKRYCFIHGV